MKIIDVTWSPIVNMIRVKCDCGNVFSFRIDRWKVRCYNCNKVENINKLRNNFVKDCKYDDCRS
uniref:Uncharacterized protein n=1 Tax=viral metagenome TaxID=1070528 RepID=A0A6M3K475_9ZZZZ